MRLICKKLPFAVLGKAIYTTLLVLIPILFLNGCALQKPFRFTPKSVTQISYNPAHCFQLQDGRFKCKDVVFTVATVQPNLPNQTK